MAATRPLRGASRVRIVPLSPADLPAVMELEHRCFAAPWPVQAFHDEFTTEWAHLFAALDDAGDLCGYSDFWFVRGEVHLLNLAVAPERQRQGIGRQLVLHLLDLARRDGGRFVHLEVRRGNTAAIHLYQSLGFEQVGVRENYYQAEREDALVLWRGI